MAQNQTLAPRTGMQPRLPSTWALLTVMTVVGVVALALAVRAPLATTVLGLIAFGVLHNVLEIRYVAGRFADVLTGWFGLLLVALITGIVACRVAGAFFPTAARYAEIVLCYVILAAGCRAALRGWRLAGALLVLAVAAATSIGLPGYHFVVLTHLHNVVPLCFLWEWSSRLPTAPQRRAFRLAQVAWVIIIPLAILAGAADPLIRVDADVVRSFVGNGAGLVAETAPPAVSALIGTRFLVMFAFMALMHYLVWVAFLPRFTPEATEAFERRVPWLGGRRAWILGIGAGAALAVLFCSDYWQGKALYGAIASYHAYLEFPILLAMIMGLRKPRTARSR